LIPHKFNDQIQKATSKNEILAIAEDLDIAPGIVVGRYQFLTKKLTKYNSYTKSIKCNVTLHRGRK